MRCETWDTALPVASGPGGGIPKACCRLAGRVPLPYTNAVQLSVTVHPHPLRLDFGNARFLLSPNSGVVVPSSFFPCPRCRFRPRRPSCPAAHVVAAPTTSLPPPPQLKTSPPSPRAAPRRSATSTPYPFRPTPEPTDSLCADILSLPRLRSACGLPFARSSAETPTCTGARRDGFAAGCSLPRGSSCAHSSTTAITPATGQPLFLCHRRSRQCASRSPFPAHQYAAQPRTTAMPRSQKIFP